MKKKKKRSKFLSGVLIFFGIVLALVILIVLINTYSLIKDRQKNNGFLVDESGLSEDDSFEQEQEFEETAQENAEIEEEKEEDEPLEECLDLDEDGYLDKACGGNDCNDEDDSINPSSEEYCGEDGSGNGLDDNCNDQVDEICGIAPPPSFSFG